MELKDDTIMLPIISQHVLEMETRKKIKIIKFKKKETAIRTSLQKGS